MKTNYRINQFSFSIECPNDFIIPDHFKLFQIEEASDFVYEVQYVDELPKIDGKAIFNKPELLVLNTPAGEVRYLSVKGWDDYYAISHEDKKQHVTIYFKEEFKNNLSIDPFFCSLFSLEKHTIIEENMILHCAYMIHHGKAILFSAPSETGKTTQATLWEKYRGTSIINGDKALLSKKEGKWYANGWPVCGSSDVCFNESYPIKCIVMLSQAKENTVELLDPLTAFKQLYSQITNNVWNTNFNITVMELIDQLIKEVPIYHLACDISEEAVNVLEKAIYE